MVLKVGDIVESAAGHDAGERFAVLKTDGEFVLLADGRRRKAEKPKRKKVRHCRFTGVSACEIAEKDGQVTNKELRALLGRLTNKNEE